MPSTERRRRFDDPVESSLAEIQAMLQTETPAARGPLPVARAIGRPISPESLIPAVPSQAEVAASRAARWGDDPGVAATPAARGATRTSAWVVFLAAGGFMAALVTGAWLWPRESLAPVDGVRALLAALDRHVSEAATEARAQHARARQIEEPAAPVAATPGASAGPALEQPEPAPARRASRKTAVRRQTVASRPPRRPTTGAPGRPKRALTPAERQLSSLIDSL